MKKFILSAMAALFLPLAAHAVVTISGSVPGKINYQGRLERDNAPITGTVHLRFRLYNSATANNTGGALCGASTQPCLWDSQEIIVQAAQGIFSADLTPPIELFTGGHTLFLEVQVESDTLSPREPLNSVAYSLVAKKLEDGASVEVSSLNVSYQVYLASFTSASVGVGNTIRPGTKLTVDGDIEMINGGKLKFPGGSFFTTAEIGTAYGGAITSISDASIIADNDTSGGVLGGNILFGIGSVFGAAEKARITNGGDFGINTTAPQGKLDVNGSLFVGNEGITDRTLDGEVSINGDLLVTGGKVAGMNSEAISIGETDNVIAFDANGEKMRIHSDGKVGIGLTLPASNLHVLGDIRSNTGARGGSVSMGAYAGDWTGLINEVRSLAGTHLLLQQNNPYYVGIGTNTPREKLHVRGSVRADYGVEAATAAFSGDVRVNGNLRVQGDNKRVYLTSTTIYGDSTLYGDLTVTGSIGSVAGVPAYKASSQTFSGINTFLGQVLVSSDILSSNRIGAGALNFNFPGSKYLQVGDKDVFPNDNAMAYLVGGSNANAKLNFYRGAAESARFETQGDKTLALVIDGRSRTLTDSTYHRIQNSVVWISTGFAGTPSIFVSSSLGNVGVGTSVMEPNWKLTVDGNLRISGTGNALIFPDGSSMATSSATSASGISTNGNAVVQSDADQVNGGDVIMRAGAVDGLVLKSGGNIGVGTLSPTARLQIRGGDLVLGTPVNPYSGDSNEDLVVGGNIVFDGAMIQRSIYPVLLSGLMVSGDVYLSTGTGKKTGIGNFDPIISPPVYTLDVKGAINTNASILTDGITRISNTGVIGSGGANATWDGITINANRGGTGLNTVAADRIIYTSGANTFAPTAITLYGRGLIDDADDTTARSTLGLGSIATQDSNNVTITGGNITNITDLAIADGGTGRGSWTQYGLVYAPTTGSLRQLGLGTNVQVLHGNAAGAAAWGAVSLTADVSGVLPVANGGTGPTLILPSANGGTGANLNGETVGAVPYFSGAGVMSGLNASVAANYLLQGNAAAAPTWVKSTNVKEADTIVRRDGSGGFYAGIITADEFVGNTTGRSRSIENTVGGDDYIRVRGDSTGVNAGYLEIATADDGTEPIYVRQYTGAFAAVQRTATLLDEAGDTRFPRYVYADHFNMTASINATNPVYLVGTWGAPDNFLRYVTPANVTVGKATALATNGGNCGANTFPLGVDVSGAVESCSNSISGNAATVTTNANLTGVVTSAGNATSIAAGAITNAMLANGAVANLSNTNTGDETNATIKTKLTAATGANDGYLTLGNWTTFNNKQAAGSYITALTGDVTASGPGSVAATIANGAVSLAKMASMATDSFLGRNTAGIGAPEVLSIAAVKTLLNLANTNTGDNAANTTYASDYRAANFTAGTDYLAPGTGLAGRAICWKTATTLSYCTNAPDVNGACTCN